MRSKLALAGFMATLLSGCVATPRQMQVDQTAVTQRPIEVEQISCPWHLLAVEDKRETGAYAGRLGATDIQIADATGMLTAAMKELGVNATGGRGVALKLHRLYLGQKLEIVAPVAVVEAFPENGPSFVVRAQHPAINWNGEGTVAERLADTLRLAAGDVAKRLDQQCQ